MVWGRPQEEVRLELLKDGENGVDTEEENCHFKLGVK